MSASVAALDPRAPASAKTLQLQAAASDPAASAWVSANAGSGKTTVLVRRVLRLLLDDVDPARILCLTYTTAAAANMANRLFRTLAGWVRLGDRELDESLRAVLERAPTSDERTRARRLFAQALETPGGLKLQTIHAFCTRILQTAPFEARIPAHFEVISETDRAAAVENAIGRTLARASEDGEALKASLDRIALAVDDQSFRKLIGRALDASSFLLGPEGDVRPLDEIRADIAAAIGADPAWTMDALQAEALASIERVVDFGRLGAAALAHGTAVEKKKWADWLAEREAASTIAARLDLWRRALRTGKGAPLAKVVTGSVLLAAPDLEDAIAAAQDAWAAHAERWNAFAIQGLSVSLFNLTRLILADYEATKRAMSALDYTDLIVRTRRLFENGQAGWLLYKLDARLDHLLVDEAQDTSRDQWSILNAITQEFMAGLGQRDGRLVRTIFAVGDEKQSIYGFQGAAPAEFGLQRRHLAGRFDALGRRFEDTRLTVSFRSTRDVIEAVDAVFAQPAAFAGLSSEIGAAGTVHETVRGDASGAVDLWDLFEADAAEEEVVWRRPVDAPERQAPIQRMARAIASVIRRWTDDGHDDLGRPFAPGDALILMPKRKAAFGAVVRALKDAGVPVAGMDRLKLATHIAVEDLIALGRAAQLPDDDLTLAVALKSPIFNVDEEALIDLCVGRAGSLRASIAASARPEIAALHERLTVMEAMAAELGPFAFYTRILSVFGGRKAMLARLGAEAADAIDAFLIRALDHERLDGPSLTCFLTGVEASSDDVKRDLAIASGEVRVMTVHGAKGLEAGTVFIADIGMPPAAQMQGPLIEAALPGANDEASVALWAPRAAEDCAASARAREALRQKAVEEHHRLLYVALTRAENRVILCGVRPARGKDKVDGQSWYGLVEAGLTASAPGLVEVEPVETASGPIGRRRFKVTPPQVRAEAAKGAGEEAQARPLPEWALRALPREDAVLPPLAPAHALAAADRADREADRPEGLALRSVAAEAGRFVHLLLQWLPAVEGPRRETVAHRLAQRHAAGASRAERERLIADTLAVMASFEARALFGEGSLAEVEIGGRIETAQGPRPVSGRIDRLLVREDYIVLADFKTTQSPPGSASSIDGRTLTQLGAYRALLRGLYPGRPIRTLAIYTTGPVVFEADPAALDRAFRRITGL